MFRTKVIPNQKSIEAGKLSEVSISYHAYGSKVMTMVKDVTTDRLSVKDRQETKVDKTFTPWA